MQRWNENINHALKDCTHSKEIYFKEMQEISNKKNFVFILLLQLCIGMNSLFKIKFVFHENK